MTQWHKIRENSRGFLAHGLMHKKLVKRKNVNWSNFLVKSEEVVWIRGFLRFDHLSTITASLKLQHVTTSYFTKFEDATTTKAKKMRR